MVRKAMKNTSEAPTDLQVGELLLSVNKRRDATWYDSSKYCLSLMRCSVHAAAMDYRKGSGMIFVREKKRFNAVVTVERLQQACDRPRRCWG